VDPNGVDTTYYFEYGTTSTYGSTTATTDAGSGTSSVDVTATISGLLPDTTYAFALVATNASGSAVGDQETFQTVQSSCVAQHLVVVASQQALTQARDALKADKLSGTASVTSAQQQLASDQAAETVANAALADAQSQLMNAASTFTSLPTVGTDLVRGSVVYSLENEPVPLFYGTTVFYRALYLGVGDGPDVAQLQSNLIALGFGQGISASSHFSKATEQALKAWQSSIGVAPSGVFALGDVVVELGPIQVNALTAAAGQAAQPGAAVLTVTSTTRVVSIALDSSQQSEVKVGDAVIITLPDQATTPGVVTSIGKVATSSSSGSTTGGGSTSTITVIVTPSDPSAVGNLDQAPVEVAITNASVASALVVPVNALVALSSGGYAVEVTSGGSHHLVAVTLGIFDDADGLVQVSGSGLAAGQKVVVPAA
jgi:peptidoglycan hydrolase-like protein with peptidoglycan-binding domain